MNLEREVCRELLLRVIEDAPTPILGHVDYYLDLVERFGFQCSVPSWDEEGWGYGAFEFGGRVFFHVTEMGWQGIYDSVEDIGDPDGSCEDVTVEVCDTILREALRRDEFLLDPCEALIPELGEGVFYQGSPWGEAVATVYHIGGVYLMRRDKLSDTEGSIILVRGSSWTGPFTSLEEAIGPQIHVGPSTETLSCEEWSDQELISRLVLDEARDSIFINGEEWTPGQIEHAQRLHR